MRLTLEALGVLDAIERKGSFAAAAEELHRVPSALTYTVQKLEQDLGLSLFDRSGHRAVLTPAGQELLREGRRLLHAAVELEERAQRVATGYEVELRIALDTLIPFDRLFPLCTEFYREDCGSRLKLLCEVYGGVWDALLNDRADLVIGAPGEGPGGGGYRTRSLSVVKFVFAVAPTHPLAALPEPLTPDAILKYRAVSVADSSRNLPPRTAGLLTGQEVLTVPDLQTKIAAQCAGLGVGYIPNHLVKSEVRTGRLILKQVVEPKPDIPLCIAWRTSHRGKALRWFLEHLEHPGVLERLLT